MSPTSRLFPIGRNARIHWFAVAAGLMLCGVPIAAAQSLPGPFERFNSWWRNPSSGTLGISVGTQICIDLDGNTSTESCYSDPGIPAGADTNLRLSPTRRILMAFGNPTTACGGESMVLFFSVPDPPADLALIDFACIPNGINAGLIGFYDTGLCCDGQIDLACAGALGLVCTDGGMPLLGVSPQRIASVADLGDSGTQRVQIHWFDLNAGTHDTTFPGFNEALQLTRARVSPYGDVAFVHHDTEGTNSDYTLVDLCGGTRLGRSLSSNVGGALFNLPLPIATVDMLDGGGGNFEVRVTHPGLTGGMLDIPFTPCSGTPPPDMGACCRTDGCTPETADDCTAVPGEWLGPGSVCSDCPTHTLSVNLSGPGSVSSDLVGISCPSDCSEDYPEGAIVTLTASAGAGAQFVNWTGNCAGTNPIVLVLMDADKKCTANFRILADLSIDKDDDADPVIAGTMFTYSIFVGNGGPSTATGVVVNDSLPFGLIFDPTTSDPACTLIGATVTCALGSLASGTTRMFTIGVQVDPAAGGSIINTASVVGSSFDPVSFNNSASATTLIIAMADLSVSLSATPEPVLAGGRLLYEMEIHNAGPSAATGVTITDTLPAGVTPVGDPSNPTQISCGVGSGRLVAGQSVTLAFAVLVDAATASGTILTNVVEVSANEKDPDSSNNIDTVNSNVVTALIAPAAIEFIKIADTSTPIPSGVGNFTRLFGGDYAALSQGNVAFRALGAAQDGIYTWINGVLEVVADTNTPIPGGVGNFGAPASGGFSYPSIDGADVAFGGDSATISQRGVYARIGGVLDVVADKSSFPPGAPFPFSTLGGQSLDDGHLSFWAFVPANPIFGGIYLGDHGGFTRVADQTTFVPGGSGRFSGFNPLTQYRRGNVAFFGRDSTFGAGLYTFVGGVLQVVANRNTPIPGGIGFINLFIEIMAYDGSCIAFVGHNAALTEPHIFARDCLGLSPHIDMNTPVPCGNGIFTNFFELSIHEGNTAFVGLDNGRPGLYADLGGKLIKVIRVLDQLDGKKITGLRMGREGLYGNQLAFIARFIDGSEGVFLANLSRSGVCHPFDVDTDGDRDLGDQAAFDRCFSGPGMAYAIGCEIFDADGDGDLDSNDFQAFVAGLGGPLAPPPIEACCLPNAGGCLMVDPDACQFVLFGTVKAGEVCANDPCSADFGACCSFKGCFETDPQTCAMFEGQFFPGETCRTAPCKSAER